MKVQLVRFLFLLMMIFNVGAASAALTCTAPVATAMNTAYATTGVVPNVTQISVDFTCKRTLAGDATTVFLRGNNSNTCAGGGNSDASFTSGGTTSCIDYEVYRTIGCATLWSTGAAGAYSVAIPSGPLNTNISVATQTLYGCITVANQAPAAGNGTYTDSLPIQVRTTANGTLLSSGTLSTSIIYLASCSAPSVTAVTFGSYVALQATALQSTGGAVTVNCTSNLPYTMALSSSNGLIAAAGLNYSLSLQDTGGNVVTGGRGTGANQTYKVQGTMASGQAGSCTSTTCSGTNVGAHTLTLTY